MNILIYKLFNNLYVEYFWLKSTNYIESNHIKILIINQYYSQNVLFFGLIFNFSKINNRAHARCRFVTSISTTSGEDRYYLKTFFYYYIINKFCIHKFSIASPIIYNFGEGLEGLKNKNLLLKKLSFNYCFIHIYKTNFYYCGPCRKGLYKVKRYCLSQSHIKFYI